MTNTTRTTSLLLLGCLLLASSSYGQSFDGSRRTAPLVQPVQRFVHDPSRMNSATAELRAEAAIYTEEIRFKQIVRWSDADAPALQPLGELVIAQLAEKKPFRTVTVAEIKAVLTEAGINEAMIRFTGATACTVSRANTTFNEGDALQQWITAKESGKADVINDDKALDALVKTVEPAAPVVPTREAAAKSLLPSPQVDTKVRSLRNLLTDDVANRLGIARENLQVTFNPTDEKLLNLIEGTFRFNVEPQRVKALGNIRWDVTVIADGGSHKTSIGAMARAWQDEVVVTKPLTVKQVIREEDLTTRRVLTDETSIDPILAIQQVIGQQAGRDLRPGTVMTARLVEAVPLVKAGQLVSLTIGQGAIRVKTVGRAQESGTFGQTIKVKNETNRDVYDVTVTGPQTASVGDIGADVVASK